MACATSASRNRAASARRRSAVRPLRWRGWLKVGRHPAAIRAKEILAVKFAAKEIELYAKLLLAGKFHASFIVIGALSSRMAGADGLNAQGIKHTKEVRQDVPHGLGRLSALWRRLQFLRGDHRRRGVQ